MSETSRRRFSGRDAAEALAAARSEFGVARNEIEYEVIARREVGPIGSPNALIEIEAWVVPARSIETNDDRPARGGRGFSRDRGGREGGGRDRGGRGFGGRSPEGSRDRRFERGANRRETESIPPLELLPPAHVTDREEILRTLGNALVGGLGLDLKVERISATEAGVRIHFDGDDAHYLIEEEATGLEALQYLANRILHKDGRLEAKITIDSGGWREEREQHLLTEAERIAREVSISGGDRALVEPLTPYERRLVHVALQSTPGVKTYSVGEGFARRLHIAKATETDA
jgi:spoIIIJ-associated protein